MKTKWMILLLGLSGGALAVTSARSTDFQPLVVNNPTGTLRIQQSVPCADDVDQTTPVTSGHIEISPATGIDVPGGKQFALTRAGLGFAPFSISRTCFLDTETRNYTEVGVQLGHVTSFVATPAGGGIFNVTIPKDDFLIYEATIVNGQSESGLKHPKDDVTGTIDLVHGIVQLHVVVGMQIRIRAGCAFDHCLIDTVRDGTLTADISGIGTFPDADGDGVADGADNCRFVANPDQSPVPTPVVTAPPGVTLASCQSHQIGTASAVDVCDAGPVTVTNNAPGVFARGANLVMWSGQDTKGRVATAPQSVTVVDRTPPAFTFIPPDLTLNNCGAAALGVPAGTDDCAGTPTFTNDAPSKFFVGTTPVTWTAHDVSGNTAATTQMVTVRDLVAPAAQCAPTEDPDDDRHDHDGHDHDGHDRDGHDRDGHDGDDHDDIDDGFFRVFARDDCGATTIRIGTFTLANGEVIKITRSHKPGVTLVGASGHAHTKHFKVGPGENVIASTDGSGNVGRASCVVPHEHGRDE